MHELPIDPCPRCLTNCPLNVHGDGKIKFKIGQRVKCRIAGIQVTIVFTMILSRNDAAARIRDGSKLGLYMFRTQ